MGQESQKMWICWSVTRKNSVILLISLVQRALVNLVLQPMTQVLK